jgi:adenylosuccinate lyase
MTDTINNTLADRYASAEMQGIWSPRGKIIMEREFWIAVVKAQRSLGVEIPQGAVEAYERVRDDVDLEDIRRREAATRHDVKARIDAFCALAGHEYIHLGMTSRDLTENVEQLQVYRALKQVRYKSVAALLRLGARADEWSDLVLSARTHNVPAQATTVGRRLVMFGEEMLLAVERLDREIASYPVRGLKGAVGTQQDLLVLLDGDMNRVRALEAEILNHLGLPEALASPGQIYPRSLDLLVVGILCGVAAGPANFAKTLRLMAGAELAAEGFSPGQVGSSAMPHKINTRSCERISGFATLLKGYLAMAADLSGDQWNEGDVSCSVVRRVMLPDSFFAIDGLLETFLTVLDQMEVFPAMMEIENERNFPFLVTGSILAEAVRKGAGRERAHAAIKIHAVAVAGDLRSGRIMRNDLLERLAGDDCLGLEGVELEAILEGGRRSAGAAREQVAGFQERLAVWQKRYPETAEYRPEPIL